MGVFGTMKNGISRVQSGAMAIKSEIMQTKSIVPETRRPKPPKDPKISKKEKNVPEKKLIKNRWLTFGTSFLLFGFAGLTGLLTIHNLGTGFVLSAILFTLLGTAYLLVAPKYPTINNTNLPKEGLIIFITYFFGVIGYTLWYYFLNKYYSDQDIFLAVFLGSTISFVLPFLIFKTYLVADSIQPRIFKSWFFPEHMVDSTGDWDPRRHVFVTLVFSKSLESPKRTEVRSRFPLNAGLASIIYEFVNDYNVNRDPMNPIRDLRIGGWQFYVMTRFGKRLLDPDLNIRENKILDNEKVYLERVLSNG